MCVFLFLFFVFIFCAGYDQNGKGKKHKTYIFPPPHTDDPDLTGKRGIFLCWKGRVGT